jgi:hypothetical protein
MGTVNVKTASFTTTETDWTSSDGQFRLTREYSSRNLYLGIFGFGWCSNLEMTLTANPDGSLKVSTCNGSMNAVFQKREPLMRESLMREPLTDEAPVFTRPGTDEILVARDGQFFLYRENAIERFDKKGRWIAHQKKAMGDSPSENWTLEYNPADFPQRLTINGQVLQFEPLYGARRVKRIYTQKYETAYLYNDQDLAFVRAAHLGISYKYDDFHNLIFIRNLNGGSTEIAYEVNTDRVTHVKTENCDEKYHYVSQPLSFRTEILTVCQGRQPVNLKYDFVWRLQQARLTTLKIQRGRDKMIATYGDSENLISLQNLGGSI